MLSLCGQIKKIAPRLLQNVLSMTVVVIGIRQKSSLHAGATHH
jgi:hypothetical protein